MQKVPKDLNGLISKEANNDPVLKGVTWCLSKLQVGYM